MPIATKKSMHFTHSIFFTAICFSKCARTHTHTHTHTHTPKKFHCKYLFQYYYRCM